MKALLVVNARCEVNRLLNGNISWAVFVALVCLVCSCSCEEFLYEAFSLCWGGLTVTEHPHRAELKPPVSSNSLFPLRKHQNIQKIKKTLCVFQVSPQLLLFYLKTVTFLHFTELHVSAVQLLCCWKCWIFLWLSV